MSTTTWRRLLATGVVAVFAATIGLTGSPANAATPAATTALDDVTIQAWPSYCHVTAEYPLKVGGSISFRGHINCGDETNIKLFNKAKVTATAYRNDVLISSKTVECINDNYCFAEHFLTDQAGTQCYSNLVSVWVWTRPDNQVGFRQAEKPNDGCTYY